MTIRVMLEIMLKTVKMMPGQWNLWEKLTLHMMVVFLKVMIVKEKKKQEQFQNC